MTATTATQRLQITARDLRPGDIVIEDDGRRIHAAFDVEQRPGAVLAHTAIRDQEDGVPAVVPYETDDEITVTRRADGPAVTHTDLVLMGDGSVQVTRW